MSLLSQGAELSRPIEADDARAELSVAEVSDFLALMKPRVMSLVVFTALVGILVAPGELHPVLAFASLLAIAIGAGASGALNMWFDADIDALMTRTRTRPVPAGRVTAGEAVAFGVTLGTGSVMVLGLVANWFAAALLAFTIFFYAVIYTMWLKRWTAQNIVIGGAAGALPPVIGWVAVTGSVGIEPLVLFLIIFVWTPPHFWALALLRADDYARAGVPMLPVVSGGAETRRQILIYSLILAPLGVVPCFVGLASFAYGAVAVASGAVFVWLAWRLVREGDTPAAERTARGLFAYSILYLFLVFATLAIDNRLADILDGLRVAG
jgi:protoheme IX farnesyltransferase